MTDDELRVAKLGNLSFDQRVRRQKLLGIVLELSPADRLAVLQAKLEALRTELNAIERQIGVQQRIAGRRGSIS